MEPPSSLNYISESVYLYDKKYFLFENNEQEILFLHRSEWIYVTLVTYAANLPVNITTGALHEYGEPAYLRKPRGQTVRIRL